MITLAKEGRPGPAAAGAMGYIFDKRWSTPCF